MKPPTLRKRIDRLLAFEQAIDLNILLSITDREGTILSANNKFCETSQYTEAELTGKNHNIVNADHHPKSFFAEMWNVLLGGHAWKGEIKNKCKDGTYYWVDAVIVPVTTTGNNISEFLSLSVIISKTKETELALADAAFTLSHKIRQPFVNMQALLTFILLEDMPMDEIKRMAKIMQAELEKIDHLTRQMALDMHNYKIDPHLNSLQL